MGSRRRLLVLLGTRWVVGLFGSAGWFENEMDEINLNLILISAAACTFYVQDAALDS